MQKLFERLQFDCIGLSDCTRLVHIMVDYSKWDKMDFSDSSDSEEEDSKVPRVTALDSGSRVTFGKDGIVEINKSSSTSQPRQALSSSTSSADIPVVSSSVSGDTIDISTMNNINSNLKDNMQQDTSKIQQLQTQLTLNGGEHFCTVNSPTSNQDEELKLPLYWSQDRYTVTLRVGFPPSIFPSKSIRINVKGALKYTDRFSAVGSGGGGGIMSDDPSFGSIEVTSLDDKGEETMLLYGSLPRPIHLNEGEDEIDFEIEDNHLGDNSDECTKIISITLPKAVPMAGLVLWWDCPLIGYPKIDVSNIQGRQSSKGGDHGQQNDKKEAWKKAWDEAHVMFKEKVKTRVKQEINVDE